MQITAKASGGDDVDTSLKALKLVAETSVPGDRFLLCAIWHVFWGTDRNTEEMTKVRALLTDKMQELYNRDRAQKAKKVKQGNGWDTEPSALSTITELSKKKK